MLYIISLLIVALAAMGLAVAAVRRPLIACPLAGAAAGVLLVEAAALWLLAWDVAAAASAASGVAAAVWGVRLALAYADQCRAADERLETGPRPVLAERRDDIGGHTVTIEDGPDGRTVVERGDGLLIAVVRTEHDLAYGESIHQVARAAAARYPDAVYVTSLHESSSSARADEFVNGLAGGAL